MTTGERLLELSNIPSGTTGGHMESIKLVRHYNSDSIPISAVEPTGIESVQNTTQLKSGTNEIQLEAKRLDKIEWEKIYGLR